MHAIIAKIAQVSIRSHDDFAQARLVYTCNIISLVLNVHKAMESLDVIRSHSALPLMACWTILICVCELSDNIRDENGR